MIKIEHNDSYERSPSGAIINTNKSAYQQHVDNIKEKVELEMRVRTVESKLDSILTILEKMHGSNK